MAKCKLYLTLDSPERSYRPGDPIKGELEVVVKAECRCNSLTVNPVLSAFGVSPSTTGNRRLAEERFYDGRQLFAGTWKPGEYAYPLTLTAPEGPAPYTGKHVSLSWEIKAQAEFPWRTERVTKDITLVNPVQMPTLQEPAATGEPQDVLPKPKKELNPGCLKASLVIDGLAIIATAVGVWVWIQYDWFDLFIGGVITAAVWALISWYVAQLEKQNQQVPQHQQLVGQPQLRVEDAGHGYRGAAKQHHSMACTVWVKPDCPPLEVKATLAVEEQARSWNDGQNRHDTWTELLHRQTVPLSAADQAGTYRGRLPLPTGLPASYQSDEKRGEVAELRWQVTAVAKPLDDDWSTSTAVVLQVR